MDRIRDALPALPRSERQVAERILAEPGEAIALSIAEFAGSCGVSQSTVSRLCGSLGISGYAALRLNLANDFAVSRAPDAGARPARETPTELVGAAIDSMRGSEQLLSAATGMSTAPYVEIWPSPDLALAGMRLADKLTEMSIPAANVPSQAAWASRILGWHPAGSVVVILGDAAIGQEAKKGLARARVHGVRVMFCGSRLAQAASPITDWQVPVPSALPPDLVPFALSEALMGAVADACRTPGPVGPASCQRPWPQVERVFLQGAQEPIPALVLRQENPDDRCPVVIYFPGMHSAKENALPGMPDNPNTVCPKIVSALLNSGYHVVVLDTQAHGERKRAWENPEELIRRSLTGDGPDLLMRTRTDARVIVDGVAGLGLSSRQDVAAVGQSWGGLQAILTMAGDERIRCGVGIMPTLRLTTLRPFAGLAGARRLEEGLPGEHFGPLLAPRPLLLVAGDRDQLAPSEHVRAFADAVEPAYGRTAPVNLRHVTLAGLDHEFDPRQVEVTLGWLNEHLGKDQSPGSTRPGTGLCQGD